MLMLIAHRRLRLAALTLLLSMAAPLAEAASLPRQSPELAINLGGGKQVLLSQYRGKVVAVIFILTYCPHCQKAIQCLIKDQNELGPRGFQVMASAIENMAAAGLPGFMRTFNPPFPVGISEQKAALDYMEHPLALIPHMPLLAFVDREGLIRAQYEGDSPLLTADQMEKTIRDQIEELLKPPPARKNAAKKSAAPPKK